jgi:ribosomal protein L12E/L44/L45/RPP1/RPP2
MYATQEQAATQPGITFLNMSGDVTITWDDSNCAHVQELVKRKMAEGYSFFILQPRMLSILGNKKVKLTDEAQLDKAVGVVVPDEAVNAIVSNLGDPDLEEAVKKGQARLARAPKGDKNTIRRASSAEEVLRHQSVAVRPIVGG